MPTTSTEPTRRYGAPVAIAVAALLALATPAIGAPSESQQGAQVLQSLQAGKATCASLKATDFDHIGEYVIERMLGSASTHQAMNQQMAAIMGTSGATQAHVFMGRRFASCATGRAPVGFSAMMGMMGAGMMGSAYGGGTGGMMGSGSRGTGSMMGSGNVSPTAGANSRWGSGDTAMVVMMGVLIAAVVGALAAWRAWRRRPGDAALETLQARYARGDIDQQEFTRRRKALGGTS